MIARSLGVGLPPTADLLSQLGPDCRQKFAFPRATVDATPLQQARVRRHFAASFGYGNRLISLAKKWGR